MLVASISQGIYTAAALTTSSSGEVPTGTSVTWSRLPRDRIRLDFFSMHAIGRSASPGGDDHAIRETTSHWLGNRPRDIHTTELVLSTGYTTGGTRIRNGLFCGGRTAPVLLVCRYWDWSQIEGMSQARIASEGFRLEIPHARAVTVHFLQFWKPYTTLAITPCEWRCHSVESRLD